MCGIKSKVFFPIVNRKDIMRRRLLYRCTCPKLGTASFEDPLCAKPSEDYSLSRFFF